MSFMNNRCENVECRGWELRQIMSCPIREGDPTPEELATCNARHPRELRRGAGYVDSGKYRDGKPGKDDADTAPGKGGGRTFRRDGRP